MFTEAEKEKARTVQCFLYPIDALGDYLNPHYLPVIDAHTLPQTERKIPAAIPKKIVLFWHEKNLSEEIRQVIWKIREHNQEYQFVLFDADQAYHYIRYHYGQDLATLYKRRCIHPAMQSDLFRVCYLLQEGGIYVDVDIHGFNALDSMFVHQDFDCFLLYAFGNPCCIENGFIAASPQNRLLSLWLDRIQENLTLEKVFDSIWSCTGPGVISVLVLDLLLNKILSDDTGPSPLDRLVLAPNSFTGRAYSHAELSYKRSALGNWRKFRLPKALYRL